MSDKKVGWLRIVTRFLWPIIIYLACLYALALLSILIGPGLLGTIVIVVFVTVTLIAPLVMLVDVVHLRRKCIINNSILITFFLSLFPLLFPAVIIHAAVISLGHNANSWSEYVAYVASSKPSLYFFVASAVFSGLMGIFVDSFLKQWERAESDII